MEKLGAGIIGCGAVAEEYVKAFQRDERSEVRALVSRNRAHADVISRDDSRVTVRVIKTNEELMIARQTYKLIGGK